MMESKRNIGDLQSVLSRLLSTGYFGIINH